MPQYIVQGPDGRRYIVEGPGAPGAQVAPLVAPQAPAPAVTVPSPAGEAVAPAPGPSYARSALSGTQDALIRTALGVRQLFGGLSDEQKAVLEQMRLDEEADPNQKMRKGAGIATNIATLAVPGAAAERGARALVGATSILRRALAAAGGSGATEFATSVGEGDTAQEQLQSKLKNAGAAAATGGVLQGGLERVASPFRASVDAQRLFAQGVNPTLQQGADGRVGRFVGGLAAGVASPRNRQEAEVADALLARVTDGNVIASQGTGRQYAGMAEDYVQKLYDQAFQGKKFPLAPRKLGEATAEAGRLNKTGQMMREAQQAQAQVGNIIGPSDMNRVNRNVPYATLRADYLTRLAQAASAEKNPEVRDRILSARDYLVQNVRNPRLSPDELAYVTNVLDPKWYDVKRMQEATKGAVGEEEGLTLSRLARAYANRPPMASNTTAEDLINPAYRILGPSTSQQEALSTRVNLNRIYAGLAGAGAVGASSLFGLGIPTAAIYGTSMLGQTAGGAKALLGQTKTQQKLADMLRNYVVTTPIVPAFVQEE